MSLVQVTLVVFCGVGLDCVELLLLSVATAVLPCVALFDNELDSSMVFELFPQDDINKTIIKDTNNNDSRLSLFIFLPDLKIFIHIRIFYIFIIVNMRCLFKSVSEL